MPNARRGEGESGARLAPKTGQKKGRPEGRKGVTGFFCRASLRFQNGTPVSLWLPAGTDGRLMAALIFCPAVCHPDLMQLVGTDTFEIPRISCLSPQACRGRQWRPKWSWNTSDAATALA